MAASSPLLVVSLKTYLLALAVNTFRVNKIHSRLFPDRIVIMAEGWYSKTNETIIPGNPDRIKASWDPLQYLNVAKYFRVFNEYPRDFNPRVHGAYCPWRNYGKRECRQRRAASSD